MQAQMAGRQTTLNITCMMHKTLLDSVKSVWWIGYLSQVYWQDGWEDTTPTVSGRWTKVEMSPTLC